MTIDPSRLRALEEQLDQRRGAQRALIDRQQHNRNRAHEALAAAAREADRRHVGAIPATLTDVLLMNRVAAEQRSNPLIDDATLRAALDAEQYAAELGKRIRAADRDIAALDRLVDACRKHVHGTPDHMPGFNPIGRAQ